MKTSIALIGFMGTGKTVVGKAVAEKLGKDFVELDVLIEQKAGKPISEIFQQDGEVAFRELEIEVIKRVTENKKQVIACGGGVILNKINIDRLKKDSVIVYLTASPKVILERVSDDEERPLLQVLEFRFSRKAICGRLAEVASISQMVTSSAVNRQPP